MSKKALLGLVLLVLTPAGALRIDEAEAERLVERALNLTKGHGGEAAVGVGAGLVVGLVANKLQGALFTAAMLGGVSTGVAVHQGWVSADTVQRRVGALLKLVNNQIAEQARRLDVNGDGELNLDDTNVAVSKVAPFVKKHPGLTGGLVGGLVAGYRLL